MGNKRCMVCKKSEDIIGLHEGIYDNELGMVCLECAHEEHIPIMKKASVEQLAAADRRYSVRERMDKMSGMDRRRTVLGRDEQMVRNNLSRLKMPSAKEKHEDVADTYYWELNMARRRKKMTLNQVSVATEIPSTVIESIEKGKIPKDFEQIFVRLEDYFGIKLLKHKKRVINFVSAHEDNAEDDILEEVKDKMEMSRNLDDDSEFEVMDKIQKNAKMKELIEEMDGHMDPHSDIDLSDPAQLEDITLDDLVDIKRRKDKREEVDRLRRQTDEMFGDDLEIL
ncbi:MAG: ribosome-binding protein aMBF1 (putative translation factor) [Patescibacteria group bacterium]|jgi:ribosome-binding protein aMBF1 (putative translation factor)